MLLRVEDLKIRFQTDEGILPAVDGISFSISDGKTLCLVGESGCGKSVTALSLMGLLPKKTALVSASLLDFSGKNLIGLPVEDYQSLRGSEMAMIFQEPMTSLNPVFTAGDQVAESLKTHFPKMSSEEVKQKVIELFDKVGLADAERRFDEYPHQLSGGIRQRVMIAMALACSPKLLIADEPTTALDVTIQAQILDLINGLKKSFGMAVLLITHDLGVVAEMADEVVVMYCGNIVEKAPVEVLFRNPLHPYTKGLLQSIPSLNPSPSHEKNKRLQTIEGQVPDLLHLPKGCRFQGRCPIATEQCSEREPPLEEKEQGHWVRCFEVKR